MDWQDLFLQHVKQTCWPSELNRPERKQREQVCFPLRFHPHNCQLTHRDIATKMKENIGLGGDFGTSIDTTIKNVVADIVQQYRPEMEADKVNLQDVLHSRRGTKFSPWREVYQWLWNFQFPRWQMDYIWDGWKEKAVRKDDWIWFSQPGEFHKAMKVPPKEEKKEHPKIKVDTSFYLYLDLKYPNRYLLLLNRGLDTNYVVCPSQAFAPQFQLSENLIVMPQERAMLQEIEFDAAGKEEYLAIVTDSSLIGSSTSEGASFSWLVPREEDPAPSWDTGGLVQLWNQLELTGSWQVFYRCFDVVDGE